MILTLVRHAIAQPRGPGLPDAARALTETGRDRFEQEVRGGIAVLEGTPEPGGMVLRMLLAPKVLRVLGR